MMMSWMLSWAIAAAATLVIEIALFAMHALGMGMPAPGKATIALLCAQLGVAFGTRWVIRQHLDVALSDADSSRGDPPEWLVMSVEWLGEPVPARVAPLVLVAAIAVVVSSPLLWSTVALAGLWGIGGLWVGALVGGIAHPDRSLRLLAPARVREQAREPR